MQLVPNFSMHSFARILWSDKAAQEKWEPVLNEAKLFHHKMERLAVVEGLRNATTALIRPEELPKSAQKFAEQGLCFLPVRRVGEFKGFYHIHPSVEEGKPWLYYGILARDVNDAKEFAGADRKDGTNHRLLGELLGYPDCCIEFFKREWEQHHIDPVWQASIKANEGQIIERGERHIYIRNDHPEVLSLLRYFGVRLVPHIPCSPSCERSIALARKWRELAEAHGLGENYKTVHDILSWPMEWSVLHGIAEIKTPMFKVSTSSMPTLEKYTVQMHSDNMPEGAPSGISFPYREPQRRLMTDHPAFKRAEQEVVVD